MVVLSEKVLNWKIDFLLLKEKKKGAYAKFLEAIDSQSHNKLFRSVHLYHDDKLVFSEI